MSVLFLWPLTTILIATCKSPLAKNYFQGRDLKFSCQEILYLLFFCLKGIISSNYYIVKIDYQSHKQSSFSLQKQSMINTTLRETTPFNYLNKPFKLSLRRLFQLIQRLFNFWTYFCCEFWRNKHIILFTVISQFRKAIFTCNICNSQFSFAVTGNNTGIYSYFGYGPNIS